MEGLGKKTLFRHASVCNFSIKRLRISSYSYKYGVSVETRSLFLNCKSDISILLVLVHVLIDLTGKFVYPFLW